MAHLMKAALVLAAGLALPALAQDGPGMAGGLWESTIQISGVTLGSMQMCMDASPETMAANMRARAEARGRPRTPITCDKPKSMTVPEGRRIEVSCVGDGHTSQQVIVLSGDLQTHVHTVMTMSRDGGPGIASEIDMHRTGECPADMKPGDTKANIDQSMIANLAQAFGKKPAPSAEGK